MILSGEGSRATSEINRLLAELPVSVNALTGVDLSKVTLFLVLPGSKWKKIWKWIKASPVLSSASFLSFSSLCCRRWRLLKPEKWSAPDSSLLYALSWTAFQTPEDLVNTVHQVYSGNLWCLTFYRTRTSACTAARPDTLFSWHVEILIYLFIYCNSGHFGGGLSVCCIV